MSFFWTEVPEKYYQVLVIWNPTAMCATNLLRQSLGEDASLGVYPRYILKRNRWWLVVRVRE